MAQALGLDLVESIDGTLGECPLDAQIFDSGSVYDVYIYLDGDLRSEP